jgi:polysaccharide export outer membrane protein
LELYQAWGIEPEGLTGRQGELMRDRLISGLLGAIILIGGSVASDAGAANDIKNFNRAEFGPPDPPSAGTAPVAYRMGPMDKLSVSVIQLPDLPKEQQVDGAGNIHMPLIGDVRAQGLTARELEGVLRTKFGEKYLQAPEVQVLVTDAMGDRVTVDGAVTQPGVYQLNGSRTLMQVIALAHGPNDKASISRVAVLRTIHGQQMAAGFDLKKIRKGEQPDPSIYGNDVVVVAGSGTKSVFTTLLQSLPIIAVFSAV